MAKSRKKNTENSLDVLNSFAFPKKIKVVSDGNELELDSFNADSGVYRYTKSITKKGMKLSATKEYLTQMLKDKLFVSWR